MEEQKQTLADLSPMELGAMCHQEHLIILRLQNELTAHQANWNAINQEIVRQSAAIISPAVADKESASPPL